MIESRMFQLHKSLEERRSAVGEVLLREQQVVVPRVGAQLRLFGEGKQRKLYDQQGEVV
jgi:hypothetical protein